MKKIYVHAPGENWILDRYAEEWKTHNPDLVTQVPYSADVLWMVDDWTWNRVDPLLLENLTPRLLIFLAGPSKLTKVVKKYGPISITGPPPT